MHSGRVVKRTGDGMHAAFARASDALAAALDAQRALAAADWAACGLPGGQPLQVRARNDGTVATYTVHYNGGLKYPHLVREPGRPDYLQPLLAPKSVGSGS